MGGHGPVLHILPVEEGNVMFGPVRVVDEVVSNEGAGLFGPAGAMEEVKFLTSLPDGDVADFGGVTGIGEATTGELNNSADIKGDTEESLQTLGESGQGFRNIGEVPLVGEAGIVEWTEVDLF